MIAKSKSTTPNRDVERVAEAVHRELVDGPTHGCFVDSAAGDIHVIIRGNVDLLALATAAIAAVRP